MPKCRPAIRIRKHTRAAPSATGTPSTLLTPPLSAATSSAAPTRAGIALISLDMSVLCLALPQIGRELEAD
jgi:hypothetical protein